MKRPWIIKVGGEILASRTARERVIRDLLRLGRTHPLVVVHGGGPQIGAALNAQGIPVRFQNGRRVTSPKGMAVIEQVLSGSINKGLAAEITARGKTAVGISARDGHILRGRPLPGLGRAAAPVACRPRLLQCLFRGGFLPVVNSVAADARGNPVNINADDAASCIATALRAERLMFLSDIPGVLDAQKRVIPILRTGDIDRLIRTGVITGGMIPKVQSARVAIRKGVSEIDIMNGFAGIQWDKGTRIITGQVRL